MKAAHRKKLSESDIDKICDHTGFIRGENECKMRRIVAARRGNKHQCFNCPHTSEPVQIPAELLEEKEHAGRAYMVGNCADCGKAGNIYKHTKLCNICARKDVEKKPTEQKKSNRIKRTVFDIETTINRGSRGDLPFKIIEKVKEMAVTSFRTAQQQALYLIVLGMRAEGVDIE